MARLIAGFATSHTPMLAMDTEEWEARSLNDRKNPDLWDTAGVRRTYPELEQIVGDRYASRAEPSLWNEQ